MFSADICFNYNLIVIRFNSVINRKSNQINRSIQPIAHQLNEVNFEICSFLWFLVIFIHNINQISILTLWDIWECFLFTSKFFMIRVTCTQNKEGKKDLDLVLAIWILRWLILLKMMDVMICCYLNSVIQRRRKKINSSAIVKWLNCMETMLNFLLWIPFWCVTGASYNDKTIWLKYVWLLSLCLKKHHWFDNGTPKTTFNMLLKNAHRNRSNTLCQLLS